MLLTLATLGGAIVLVGWVPEWRTSGVTPPEGRTAAEITNEERRTWAGIAGGLGGALGLVIALQRLQVARDDRITDRHIRAIEQLGTRRDDGEPNVEVRIGAIFALERIARDSDHDHWPIMQTLSAYVRENAPVLEDSDWVQDNPRIDVQTILTVLGRRHRRSEETNNQWLDLRTTDLRRAHLERAHLQDARLHGADLGGAHLERTDLSAATGLTQQQIDLAICDDHTKLPDGLV